MFAEKGVQQFITLPRAPEKTADTQTRKLFEDILFQVRLTDSGSCELIGVQIVSSCTKFDSHAQSDAVALNLRQNTAFAKKADGYFSSIANLVREKEFPT